MFVTLCFMARVFSAVGITAEHFIIYNSFKRTRSDSPLVDPKSEFDARPVDRELSIDHLLRPHVSARVYPWEPGNCGKIVRDVMRG